jgi:hypothetical protein
MFLFGFVIVLCVGNDNAVLDVEYMAGSAMIWETVPFNLFLWDDSMAKKMQLVTSPLPDQLILRTHAEHIFMGIACMLFKYLNQYLSSTIRIINYFF